jgi:hypothetical protein
MDQDVFNELVCQRQLCVNVMQSGGAHGMSEKQVNEELQALMEYEVHLAEQWKRLRIMMVKGDVAAPLKQGRTPMQAFMAEKVAPFVVLNEWMQVTNHHC